MGSDFFSTLGVPKRFAVDPAALQSRFYELSRELHPDRFATRPAAERTDALVKMSEVNQAYRTLSDPALRRAYLLELEGVVRPAGEAKRGVHPLALKWFDLQDEGTPQEIQAFHGEIDQALAKVDGDMTYFEGLYDAHPKPENLIVIARCIDERTMLAALKREVEKSL